MDAGSFFIGLVAGLLVGAAVVAVFYNKIQGWFER